MKRSLLVVDIETVHDEDSAEPRSKKWPPPVEWKIIAIGLLSAVQDDDGVHVEKLTCGVGNERELLSAYWSFFATRQPTVITWNGRSFDIPVLLHRAMLHGVQVKNWYCHGRSHGYSYRYSRDHHCDLLEVLTDYGAVQKLKLDTMASALGYAGKQEINGSDVAQLFADGRVQEIARYCEGDVLNLYSLFLRWLHLTGELTSDGLKRSHLGLVSYLQDRPEHRHHTDTFVSKSPSLLECAASSVNVN